MQQFFLTAGGNDFECSVSMKNSYFMAGITIILSY
jgi:hypothetical protein